MNKLINRPAEQRLLGACLTSADVIDQIIDKVAPGDFSDPRAGAIFSAIARVATRGKVNPTLVVEELRTSTELEEVGGDKTIIWLAGYNGTKDEALEAAKVIRDLARRRDQAHAARAAASTIENGGDAVIEIATLNEISNNSDDDGWTDLAPIVEAIINGTHRRLEPTILTTSGGNSMIYPSRLNIIMGAPESMKSWTAKYACVQTMMTGHPVVYVDCEESDGITCAERIYAIALGQGISKETLRTWLEGPELEDGTRDRGKRLFYYRAENNGIDGRARSQILRIVRNQKVPFVVLDGFAAAMASHNPPLEEDKARDVNMYLSGNIWPIVNAGAGVLVVDHIAKSSGGVGNTAFQQRGPRGSGAKLAAVSGVALQASVVIAGSSWTPGRVEIYVSKDRPGRVKIVQRNNKRLAGVLVSTPTNDGGIEITKLELLTPEEVATQQAEKRWDLIAAEKVSKLLSEVGRAMSKSEIKETLNDDRKRNGGSGWRAETMVKAIEFLANNNWVRIEKEGRNELIARLADYKADYGDIHCDERPMENPF
jgi:hypothetical protein